MPVSLGIRKNAATIYLYDKNTRIHICKALKTLIPCIL